ncbi:hypothetical protein [Sphingomonas xinjiangensis]|uniref:Uncharacterized protein n=1 Tax=Sphingomonas xinjiangensis TaxID=643568 RepID=A0A840YP15_9SPHN|nr:hypothetical protein [Sphingomonas xinjiangensis]MBB5711870.1 hypothetical protein [Sphingomonas xinjiangensis]
MVNLIESQLVDLRKLEVALEKRRDYWKSQLTSLTEGKQPNARRVRAPRGSLQAGILAILNEHPTGLTLGQIDRELSVRLDHYNRQSVTDALARLRNSGRADHRDNLWLPVSV